VRPTRILPGIDGPLKRLCGPDDPELGHRAARTPKGEYSRRRWAASTRAHPIEAATDVSMMTRAGVETHHAVCLQAGPSRRPPKKLLTVITKSNAQRHAMVMWDEIAPGRFPKEFPGCHPGTKELVDAIEPPA